MLTYEAGRRHASFRMTEQDLKDLDEIAAAHGFVLSGGSTNRSEALRWLIAQEIDRLPIREDRR